MQHLAKKTRKKMLLNHLMLKLYSLHKLVIITKCGMDNVKIYE